jgi:hypothetical protein
MQVATTKNKLQGSDSHWFLFFLFPFFSGLTALRNYKAPWAKNVVWAFVVFYGYTFAISAENNDVDFVRYADELKDLYGKSLSFPDMIDIFRESGEADVLKTIISILVSRFSKSPQILSATYGFIFGFFFTRTLWYIIDRLNGKLKGLTIIFLLSFFLVNPFWNINGFRFNTAILVFVYGALPFLFENKKSSLIISFLSVLVHFSFLFPLAILLVYVFARNRKNLYFGFFIISTFISNINITEFNTTLEKYVPEAFVERSEKYRDADRVEEFREGEAGSVVESETGAIIAKNWYAVYFMKILYWSLSVLLIGLYVFGKRALAGSGWLLNGYCFSLLFFGFANLMQSIPSGERYLMVAALFVLATIIFYVQNQAHEQYITKLALALLPAFLLFIIVSLRTALYSVSLTTILGNPVIAIFSDYGLSLNDIIK